MTLAIIPARGGSKGIQRKNIIPLCGKPLIAWTIEQAKASSLVSRVIVTTDDDEIADVANEYGADVYRRSAETATDTASTESALLEVIEDAFTIPYTGVTVLLQATSPVRQHADIDNAIKMIVEEPCDSVFSARYVEGYTWTFGHCLLAPYDRRRPRQQHTTRTLEENGSIYVFRSDVFLRERDRLCGRVRPYLMHPLDSFQIDEPADVALLEQLIHVRLPDAHPMATKS